MENKIWDDCQIVEKIGEGSFGEVYKAIKKDGSICAIKYISLPRSKKEIEQLLSQGMIQDVNDANNYYMNIVNREINIMKKFKDNPHIINFYDFFEEKRANHTGIAFYIRMEYATDLQTHLKNKEITVNDVIKMGIDICSALESCHKENIVHNDIKPSNIFVGENSEYKLGDFSIATEYGKDNIRTFGAVNYLPPEIYNDGNSNFSTDLYSLGLVMYKLINGELPFVNQEIDELKAFSIRMSGQPIPTMNNIDKRVMNILNKACAFHPEDRYQSVSEMKAELEQLPHIHSKKKIISFSLNQRESTIGIFTDNNIKGNHKNIVDKMRDNLSSKKKKALLLSLIMIGSTFALFKIYPLNKPCQVGYINKNGTCVKGYYYCDTGYSLVGKKCQKTVESVDAKVSYTCKSGYTLSDEICVSNDIRDPKFVYKCADGFTLNGQKCERVESADAVVTYSCPKGYINDGDQCVTVTNMAATSNYVCEDASYVLNGTTCQKNVVKSIPAVTKYVCNEGGTLKGTVCDYTVTPSYSWPYYTPKCSRGTYNYMDRLCHYQETAKQTYQCSQGTLDGTGNCQYSSVVTKLALIKFNCPAGYTAAGNQCAKISGIAATPKYNCADGMEVRGSKCYTTVSTDAVGMYDCEEGFVISGTKCYKNDFPKAIKKYTCSRVYTLNGGKCEKYEKVQPKAHYTE